MRIIPCLQLLDETLVKTTKFALPKYIGDPVNTVRIFNELEVDELCFLDIRATLQQREPYYSLLQQIADECFMPLSYGGGVNSIEQAKKIFDGLQHGTVDRSLFTDNANAYFSDQALKDFASGLAPLGTPQSFVQVQQGLRGGMTLRVYIINFGGKALRAWTYELPDGKLEQYQVAPQN